MNVANAKETTSPGYLDARSPEQNFGQLINQTARGDQTAFAELYQATRREVFGLLLRILGNHTVAEEVLLDVYMQVWRSACRYDSTRGTPVAWLMTMARSRAIDRLRSERKQVKGEDMESGNELRSPLANPEETSALSERQGQVRAALSSLNEEQRAVIERAYFAGMSHTEIATELGWPLGTVKTRTRLAMMKLREQLSAFRD